MGGFLFGKTTDSTAGKASALNIDRARRVMAEAGAKPGVLIEKPGFSLQLYEKSLWPVANILQFPDGDFVAGVGTLFYRRKMGKEALEQLFSDFVRGKPVLENLLGHFAVFIWHKRQLTLFNDYNALYHLFSLADGQFISSSFLATAAASPKLTPSTEEVYEYLVYGAFHGTETLYQEVSCLSGNNSYEVFPSFKANERKLRIDAPWAGTKISRDDLVDTVCTSLKDYFSVLVENFGDGICSALSGGYDSRLMLAILRNLGVVPKLYVYGPESGKDVKVARRLCEGEKFSLDVIDKGFNPSVSPAEYLKTFRAQLFSVDGRSLMGAADDGFETLTRQRRLENARLQLNGAGGEIYRDYWQLPDVSFSPRSMVARTYERSYIPYYFHCTNKFRNDSFFEKTARKMAASAGVKGDTMLRRDVEAVYPYYRLKYCMNLSYYPNNLLTSSLTPFIEPSLTQPSHHVPLHFKRHAGFQMALIRRMDPDVAKYPSQYGYSFSQDIRRGDRFRNWMVIVNRHMVKGQLPIPLLTKLYRRRIQKQTFPYFMAPEFTKEITGGSLEAAAEYIDPTLVWETSQMSRVITLDYLLRKFPGAV